MNFEAVLAGLPDAVIAVDTALRVVFWNGAAEELTGRSARRTQGRPLKEVLAPGASVVGRLTETLATGERRSEADGSRPPRSPAARDDGRPWRRAVRVPVWDSLERR